MPKVEMSIDLDSIWDRYHASATTPDDVRRLLLAYDGAREELQRVSLPNNLDALQAQLEETQRVKEKVFSIFNDPRYREAWSDGEILTYLLSALDPWWKEASARRAARETTAHG